MKHVRVYTTRLYYATVLRHIRERDVARRRENQVAKEIVQQASRADMTASVVSSV